MSTRSIALDLLRLAAITGWLLFIGSLIQRPAANRMTSGIVTEAR